MHAKTMPIQYSHLYSKYNIALILMRCIKNTIYDRKNIFDSVLHFLLVIHFLYSVEWCFYIPWHYKLLNIYNQMRFFQTRTSIRGATLRTFRLDAKNKIRNKSDPLRTSRQASELAHTDLNRLGERIKTFQRGRVAIVQNRIKNRRAKSIPVQVQINSHSQRNRERHRWVWHRWWFRHPGQDTRGHICRLVSCWAKYRNFGTGPKL